MEKTVSRTKKLPPFKMDIDSLEAMIAALTPHFGNRPRVSIEFKSGECKYDAKSASELRTSKEAPAQIRNVKLSIHGDNFKTYLLIWPGGSFSTQSNIATESNDVAWCAGVEELVRQYTQPHVRWYRYAAAIVMVASPFIFGVLASTAFQNEAAFIKKYPYIFASLCLLATVLLTATLRSESWFPSSVIVLREEERTWKAYSTEIAIAISIASLIVSALQIFLK